MISLVLSLRKDLLWLKFMAFGLLNSALSDTLILYYGGVEIPTNQRSVLIIAACISIGLAGLFYWAYQLTKSSDGEKKV